MRQFGTVRPPKSVNQGRSSKITKEMEQVPTLLFTKLSNARSIRKFIYSANYLDNRQIHIVLPLSFAHANISNT